MTRKNKFGIFVLYFLTFSLFGFDVDPIGNQIEEGVKKYKGQKYKESLDNFKSAEQKLGKEDEKLAFNKGTAYYKLKNYDLALKQFEKSSLSENKELKTKSLFNKGNSFYQMGDRKNAIKSFLQTLKVDPNYLPARKNLELIQKIEQQNQKNTQKQEEENSDASDNQKESDSQNQSGDSNDLKGKTSESEQENEKKESENQNKLTKEEAERILESARQRDVKRKLHKSKNSKNEIFW